MAVKSLARQRQALIVKAQKLANLHARIRDCGAGNIVPCISCGNPTAYEQSHGGHFIPTTSSATRFDERNINLQCVGCNLFRHGNQANYLLGMEKKYGRSVVDELMAKQYEVKKWTVEELTEIIDYYKAKIKEMK